MPGPTVPTDRTNVTDKQQSVIEDAEFEGGVPVFVDQKTRVITKGANKAATERTANAGTNIGSNAGVVMPHDDVPNRFLEETQGKA